MGLFNNDNKNENGNTPENLEDIQAPAHEPQEGTGTPDISYPSIPAPAGSLPVAHFRITQLADERVLVQGTDSAGVYGQEVLTPTAWAGIKHKQQHEGLEEEFNNAMEEFFRPLNEAIDDINASAAALHRMDPSAYVVLDEGTEAVEARPQVVVNLDRDSQIVRLIESGRSDRLIWINGSIEILAA